MVQGGNRHDAKGRSTGRPRNSRLASYTAPPKDDLWIYIPRKMISSRAYRSLSRASYLVLGRLIEEHLAHGRAENGRLIVTYDDFVAWGVKNRQTISNALRELEAGGFVSISHAGRASYGAARNPSRYRLTWIGTWDGNPPTNEWKAVEKANSPDTNL